MVSFDLVRVPLVVGASGCCFMGPRAAGGATTGVAGSTKIAGGGEARFFG